jgi:N-methylhydantoinase B
MHERMIARQRQDRPRVLRETAIADDGVVLTGKLDHDLLSHHAAATDVKRAPRPARAEVLFGRGPGYVLLLGGALFADVTRAAL